MALEIKFRRAYFRFSDGGFECFSEWGPQDGGGFISPAYVHGCKSGPDMQFSGLKDKNKVEIYEGDICKVLYTDWPSKSDNDKRTIEQYLFDLAKTGIVEYHAPEFVFRLGEDSYGDMRVGRHGFIQVIGNIHQRPHLIESE